MSEVSEKLCAKFPSDQIEWRIGQAGKKTDGKAWAKCLAYIQARAIMDRLDETMGPDKWKAEYSFVGATGVICKLSLKFADEWVTKEDGAEFSEIDAFKGGISGALKRAAVLWGIGRYLYDLEADFAIIVEQGTKGARYAKTKDGLAFYWVPPQLPDWALPPKAKPDPAPAATVMTPTVSAGKPVISKPPLVVSKPAVPVGTYVIPVGKYKSNPITMLSIDQMENEYAEWSLFVSDPQSVITSFQRAYVAELEKRLPQAPPLEDIPY